MNACRILAGILALACLAGPANAQTPSPVAACAPNAEQLVVCGSGPNPLIVLDETTSPSGKLAVAWRTKAEIKAEFPDPDEVENHLVRLADGKALALLVGRSWNNGRGRGNHIYRTVAWSPDSRWLLVGDGGKWSLEAIAIYAVDEASGKVVRRGLLRDVSAAAKAKLDEVVGAKKARGYLLDIAGDKKIAISNAGDIVMPMLFQIPKQEGDVDLVLRFKASTDGGTITTTPIKVAHVKN